MCEQIYLFILSIIIGSSIFAAKSSLTDTQSFDLNSTLYYYTKLEDSAYHPLLWTYIYLHKTVAIWRGIFQQRAQLMHVTLHVALNTDNIFSELPNMKTLVPAIITVID